MIIETRKIVIFEDREISDIALIIANKISKAIQFNIEGRAKESIEILIPTYALEALATCEVLAYCEKTDCEESFFQLRDIIGQEVLSISFEFFDLEGDKLILTAGDTRSFESFLTGHLTFGRHN